MQNISDEAQRTEYLWKCSCIPSDQDHKELPYFWHQSQRPPFMSLLLLQGLLSALSGGEMWWCKVSGYFRSFRVTLQFVLWHISCFFSCEEGRKQHCPRRTSGLVARLNIEMVETGSKFFSPSKALTLGFLYSRWVHELFGSSDCLFSFSPSGQWVHLRSKQPFPLRLESMFLQCQLQQTAIHRQKTCFSKKFLWALLATLMSIVLKYTQLL